MRWIGSVPLKKAAGAPHNLVSLVTRQFQKGGVGKNDRTVPAVCGLVISMGISVNSTAARGSGCLRWRTSPKWYEWP